MFCKRRPATLLERGSSIAQFFRTPILENVCEWLLLKINISMTNSEALIQSCSVEKLFLEISQNSQESTCARVFFSKVAGLRLWYSCFLVNFVKFLITLFFIEHLWWLLLQIYRKEVISDIFYPFKPFSILSFAMTEWLCHVTCFAKVYLILFFFFSYKHDIFSINSVNLIQMSK